MPYTREDLQVLRRDRIVSQFLSSIIREVVSAAHQGKTAFHMSEPLYCQIEWNEFLTDILNEVHKEFPGCDVILDDQLGITIKWN
jgi:hypothetical protein